MPTPPDSTYWYIADQKGPTLILCGDRVALSVGITAVTERIERLAENTVCYKGTMTPASWDIVKDADFIETAEMTLKQYARECNAMRAKQKYIGRV